MKHLTTVKRILAVTCLMMSLTACGLLQKKPTPPTEVVVCPSSAFIDVTDYRVKVEELTSKSDKMYHKWVADNYLKPFPIVLQSYSDLRECWDHYHPAK
jgi:predicted small lipoprotein YifL